MHLWEIFLTFSHRNVVTAEYPNAEVIQPWRIMWSYSNLVGLVLCSMNLLPYSFYFSQQEPIFTFSFRFSAVFISFVLREHFQSWWRWLLEGISLRRWEEKKEEELHSHASTHKRRGKHTSIWTHTCLKLHKGVNIRKREQERADCSTKEARERANQWRHDNELFPRQRGS